MSHLSKGGDSIDKSVHHMTTRVGDATMVPPQKWLDMMGLPLPTRVPFRKHSHHDAPSLIPLLQSYCTVNNKGCGMLTPVLLPSPCPQKHTHVCERVSHCPRERGGEERVLYFMCFLGFSLEELALKVSFLVRLATSRVRDRRAHSGVPSKGRGKRQLEPSTVPD